MKAACSGLDLKEEKVHILEILLDLELQMQISCVTCSALAQTGAPAAAFPQHTKSGYHNS